MHRRPVAANNDQELVELSAADHDTRLPQAPGQKRTLHATSTWRGETDRVSFTLRVLKWIALIFIAFSVLAGTVLSKVSLISITGRMFNLGRSLDIFPEEHTRSVLFIQLTLLFIIPELVSFIRCLMWGVFSKTTRNFPWPTRSALVQVNDHTCIQLVLRRIIKNIMYIAVCCNWLVCCLCGIAKFT